MSSSLFRRPLRAVVDHEADLELAAAVLSGDETALLKFMDYYFPRLYRFALARVNRDASLTEEIVQDTLAIAARRMGTYRGEAALLTWLTQICRRELTRKVKRETKRKEVILLLEDDPVVRAVVETIESSGADEPLKNCARDDVIRLVQLSLDHLPAKYADALEWKYVEGLSTKEIAARLELGSEAAESLLARARRAFKNDFQEIFESIGSLEALTGV
ncbi:MAG: sigma-70 family RNA polymerase sigma factor [Pseudomonadales bacterium]|jgi:RNA polymerase sigma-70 factor (ECF subfamily)|nr:sigma-70 family RNA polymerase sigma factor [Pseudomonadales bacterium]MDP7359854.1 sigma-70 family RNA polymerase sigma factor [Pseudomonadales bacterium]MDP7595721.1 sigma-70 family RNA polymerase sigma factor [Pseudomonadales bacterium]HJN49164.1 sigma-70 family RNA polymerase sigma factor [Pseudomonadales bacterium]|tara:strand:- start:843 stop:1496 length:654 start_codon:yes stop_codon:yes gene_type:complete